MTSTRSLQEGSGGEERRGLRRLGVAFASTHRTCRERAGPWRFGGRDGWFGNWGNWGLSTSKGKLLGNWCSFLVGLGQIYIYIIIFTIMYIYIYNCNQWWLWPSCGLVHVREILGSWWCKTWSLKNFSDHVGSSGLSYSYVHSMVKCHSLISINHGINHSFDLSKPQFVIVFHWKIDFNGM